MRTLKIITVLLLVTTWSIQSPAHANAPIIKKVKFNSETFALHNPKAYAQKIIKTKNWTHADYVCLNKIWTKESHWNYKAKNPTSNAYGIAQIMFEKSHLPATQIRNGIRYISYRYGNPCAAWQFWQTHYWY